MANTLAEYYKTKGQSLPSIEERSKEYESRGLGSAGDYRGTSQQNTTLLNSLVNTAPATAPPQPTPQTTPATSQSGGSSVSSGGARSGGGTIQQQYGMSPRAYEEHLQKYGTPPPKLSETSTPSGATGSSNLPPSNVSAYGTTVPTHTALLNEYRKQFGLDELTNQISSAYENIPQKSAIYAQEMSKLEPTKQRIDSLDGRLKMMESAIEASEQDIRDRVTSSGGVVTESQVQRLIAKQKAPLIDDYRKLLDERNTLANSYSVEEARAREMAGMAYEDALNPLKALESRLGLTTDLFSQFYNAGTQDLSLMLDTAEAQDQIKRAEEAAAAEAASRQAKVISTQVDDFGNIHIVTQELDGTFQTQTVGQVGVEGSSGGGGGGGSRRSGGGGGSGGGSSSGGSSTNSGLPEDEELLYWAAKVASGEIAGNSSQIPSKLKSEVTKVADKLKSGSASATTYNTYKASPAANLPGMSYLNELKPATDPLKGVMDALGLGNLYTGISSGSSSNSNRFQY